METIIEKTTVKINTKPVKDLIKTYVEKQKLYKDARKNAIFTVKDGKNIWNPMHPSEAQSKAYWNGLELRILYAAYTLLRGKSLKQMEQNYSETDSDHFLNQHKAKIEKTLEGMKQLSEIKE